VDTEKGANLLQRQETEEGCCSRWVLIQWVVRTAAGFSANKAELQHADLMVQISGYQSSGPFTLPQGSALTWVKYNKPADLLVKIAHNSLDSLDLAHYRCRSKPIG